MPSRISTLACQVNGLKIVYARNSSVCFEFENEEQLNKAKKKAAVVYKIKPPFKLHSNSKKPIFAFNIDARPAGSVINISLERFILSVTNTIATQTPMKTIPIIAKNRHL
jgi:hypothetical protein